MSLQCNDDRQFEQIPQQIEFSMVAMGPVRDQYESYILKMLTKDSKLQICKSYFERVAVAMLTISIQGCYWVVSNIYSTCQFCFEKTSV